MTDVRRTSETSPDTCIDPIVVPFTYSSGCEVKDGEHVISPSRLSLMAYDAACYIATNSGIKRLVIAGEQSYAHHTQTTGDALQLHTPAEQYGLDLTVLRNEDNRLLNTPHQVDALSDEFKPEDVVTVVCWGFHEKRIRHGFKSKRELAPVVDFVRVEDVIGHLWDTAALWGGDHHAMAREFRDRYDLEVGWESVMDRGLSAFEHRERLTRVAMWFGKNGWLLKLLTRARGTGRYDDIDKLAMPIMDTTH
ncbi:hypothetical protein KC973_00740 [Candidatus Saccharibacteria bacterium]|nr:hypothetical protein [Candidatus Saccharibacteria bacterium]